MKKSTNPSSKTITHVYEEIGKPEVPRKVAVATAPNVAKKQFSKPARFVAVDDNETTKRIKSTWKSKGNLLEKLNRINNLIDHPLTSTDCNRAAIRCQSLVRGWLERRSTSVCNVPSTDDTLVMKSNSTFAIEVDSHVFNPNPISATESTDLLISFGSYDQAPRKWTAVSGGSAGTG
jgi:hypothetical protein